MAPLIELEGVARQFGERVALRDVSVRLPPGERVALVGPSGSGKTTLLRLAGGSLRASRGMVRVDGVDVNRMSSRALKAHRARCGIIDQGSTLVAELNVHRNVLAGFLPAWPLPRVLASAFVTLEKARVAALLDRVGLSERQWDLASTLSGGQRQRVGVARALARDPTLILADEPTASLDPATARRTVELILEFTRETEATLLMSTHWVSLVAEHVDRLVGIREGRVTFDTRASAVAEADLTALYQGSRERR